MFDNLSDRLGGALKKLKGHGRLTEANIKDAMREVRMALLEADVALPVVTDFIDQVTQRALGQEVQSSLTPGQAMIKVVQAELVKIMGSANEELNLRTQPPAIVLMAGLARRGQNHNRGETGSPSEGKEKEKSRGCQRGRLPTGGNQATANPGR